MNTPLRLDVVVPTYNRATLLPKMLESLLAADPSSRLVTTVTIVDNRSTDQTRAVVDAFAPRFGGHLEYVYECKPGRSHALNAGIAATSGDLVGMIDDDEEVDRGWFQTIAEAFADPATDFIGGPYLPRFGAARPKWLGHGYGAVIGSAISGDAIQQFGPACDAMLMGGNAIIRRTVLERVGPYSPDLGRTPGQRLMSCEDEDMFIRLLAIGARGFYRPDLIIHHFVPPERLTKQYFRRWCFWHGVSQGLLDRRRPANVPYLFGVPRYMIGAAIRGTAGSLVPWNRRGDAGSVFRSELAWRDLLGFFYGKHLYRAAQDAPEPRRAGGKDAGPSADGGSIVQVAGVTPAPAPGADGRPDAESSTSKTAVLRG
jgi:glycosyltransferase involved in cell wall biosynthesis